MIRLLLLIASCAALIGCSRSPTVYSVVLLDSVEKPVATGTITLPRVEPKEGVIRGTYQLEFDRAHKGAMPAVEQLFRLFGDRTSGEVTWSVDERMKRPRQVFNFMPGKADENILIYAPLSDGDAIKGTWVYEIQDGGGNGGVATLTKK